MTSIFIKVAFLLFLICLAAALVSGILRCLIVILIYTVPIVNNISNIVIIVANSNRCLVVIYTTNTNSISNISTIPIIDTIYTILIIVTNRCLASRSFHPTESLFKPRRLSKKRESEQRNEGFEMENHDD